MRLLLMVLGIFVFLHTMSAQLVPDAKYRFEKMQWGQNVDSSQRALEKGVLREVVLPTSGQFAKLSAKVRCYQYDEVFLGYLFNVQLMYDLGHHGLIGIVLLLSPVELKKATVDVEKIWSETRKYFGEPSEVKSKILVGEAMEWRYPKTKIIAMRFSFFNKYLTIQFSPLIEPTL